MRLRLTSLKRNMKGEKKSSQVGQGLVRRVTHETKAPPVAADPRRLLPVDLGLKEHPPMTRGAPQPDKLPQHRIPALGLQTRPEMQKVDHLRSVKRGVIISPRNRSPSPREGDVEDAIQAVRHGLRARPQPYDDVRVVLSYKMPQVRRAADERFVDGYAVHDRPVGHEVPLPTRHNLAQGGVCPVGDEKQVRGNDDDLTRLRPAES